jgi:hypothetical protein
MAITLSPETTRRLVASRRGGQHDAARRRRTAKRMAGDPRGGQPPAAGEPAVARVDRPGVVGAEGGVGAARTDQVFAEALLDHDKETLSEIREAGYLTYAGRQFRPYCRAAAGQFSPKRRTLTQRLLEKLPARRPRLPGGRR